MSNYRKTMAKALQEMYPINEDNIDLMRKAAGGAAQTVKMKDGKLKMDMFTASAIMQVYDKVNPANQKKMADMINKGTKGGMMKLQDFAMKQVKSENDPEIEEEVDLDEGTEDSLGDFQDFARLYGGGDEIYVVTQGKDSNSLKVIGIEKDPNKAKKIRDRAKGARASLWGQMKSSQKVLKLKIGDPVSFEDSKNKLSFIEEVEIDESTKEYAKSLAKIADKAKKDNITDKDLETLVKLAALMKKEDVDLDEGKMSQLHQYIKDKKSAEEIAKMMKLDIKTIKALMSSYESTDSDNMEQNGKYMEMLAAACGGGGGSMPGLESVHHEIEEGAAADARRAMKRDKDFSRKDSADDDNDATDDDIKGASKNIIVQLRKVQSLGPGGDPKRRFKVEFGDGKKVEISVKMAQAITKKFNAQRKPVDKEKFQARIGKSYKDMLSALKEELQPKKESILERMNRKLKENKNG